MRLQVWALILTCWFFFFLCMKTIGVMFSTSEFLIGVLSMATGALLITDLKPSRSS